MSIPAPPLLPCFPSAAWNYPVDIQLSLYFVSTKWLLLWLRSAARLGRYFPLTKVATDLQSCVHIHFSFSPSWLFLSLCGFHLFPSVCDWWFLSILAKSGSSNSHKFSLLHLSMNNSPLWHWHKIIRPTKLLSHMSTFTWQSGTDLKIHPFNDLKKRVVYSTLCQWGVTECRVCNWNWCVRPFSQLLLILNPNFKMKKVYTHWAYQPFTGRLWLGW